MTIKIPKRLFQVLGLALLSCVTANGAPAEPSYPKTNLNSFLAHWKPTQATEGTICELEPQWVGTVRRAYLRGGESIYKEDHPNNVRFSHLIVLEDQHKRLNLRVLRGRITAQGELGDFPITEAPVFVSNLPSAKAVAESKNLDDLRKMFGPQDGLTDGWGDQEGRMHWTEGWTRFTVEAEDRLRYLNVFAHVSSFDPEKLTDVDILHVAEGIFHPADPNSAAERIKFKTGEELHAEFEANRAKARAKYPLPLRSLVEARETPDDSEFVAYKRALNEVRRSPSPELFRQFAEWIHEGTREIEGMLKNILFDDYLQLEKWEEPQRKIALRALVDALPYVKTNLDLDDLVAFLLRARGGGELNVAVSGTAGVIDIKAPPEGSSSSFSTRSRNISGENLTGAAEQCRQALKERYHDFQ